MAYIDAYIGKCCAWRHTYLQDCNKLCSPVIVKAEVYFSLFPVLPKFEVKVNVPQTVTISDDEFQVDTCAK